MIASEGLLAEMKTWMTQASAPPRRLSKHEQNQFQGTIFKLLYESSIG